MVVTNLSEKSIPAPWKPSKWILTDGASQLEDKIMWAWTDRTGRTIVQPPILPGATQGWTWLAYPLDKGWWVTAAVWDYDGKTYRQDFAKPNMSLREFNYVDCN
jgi:hypothetical protein